jgi:hypothetical protein
MSIVRALALVFIAAGIFGLAYGQFSYTKESHDAKLGPVELSVKDKETVAIPNWVGAGSIVAGVILLLIPVKN